MTCGASCWRSERPRRSRCWPRPVGIRYNLHIADDGPTVFRHAYAISLEGTVSKRKDSL